MRKIYRKAFLLFFVVNAISAIYFSKFQAQFSNTPLTIATTIIVLALILCVVVSFRHLKKY